MTAVLLRQVTEWECPNCELTDVTFTPGPHSRFHSCRGLYGLSVAMVPAGTKCRIVAVERGDWIGKEDVQYAPGNGRPVALAVTERDDGMDCVVYAPCATARFD